jgi:predicted alpha/beta superfamily hydrolase
LVAGRPNRKPANGRVRPNGDVERLALYLIFGEPSRFSMPKHTLTGNIKRHRAFPSKILGNRRDVLVYLPRGYRRLSRRRYPVLYLHDGQNVFDAATSFAGVEWGVDETAERLIKENLLEPLIIVAVANTGAERVDEYAPTRGVIDAKAKRKKRSKGLARKYGHFLMNELKPYIDRKYRTNPSTEFTGLGGSSLGGLATLAIGILYPQVFGLLMVMSPSVWWDNFAIYRLVDSIEQKPPLKIWLDTGTAEPGWEQARELLNRLVEKGWKLNKDLQYMEAPGAGHSEGAWAARVEPALRFLFPPEK